MILYSQEAEELFEKIMGSFNVPNIPQNTKCDDFINFVFTGSWGKGEGGKGGNSLKYSQQLILI